MNGKWRATVVEIARMYKTGRPVLVGTTSVEQSEALSKQLIEAAIPHQVEFVVYFHHFFCPHKPWQLSIINFLVSCSTVVPGLYTLCISMFLICIV